MSLRKTVRVALPQTPYDIAIGSGLLENAASFFAEWTGKASRAVVITDTNVDGLYAEKLAEKLAEADVETDVCVVEAGEESKSVDMADMLWQKLVQCGCDRKTVIVAVGGGVVGDLAGFVAATLCRGLRFVQVPTTLLAFVDSSVGGKVAVNLPQGKNLVGAFWQPVGVLADMETLRTLDDRQYRAGLAEVVKYGVVLDRDFFTFLEANVENIRQRDEATLAHIISRCCELKAQIVLEDEHETSGRRAVLNYGHTFAHAVEKLSGYGVVLHGEAVGIGMMFAAELALWLAPSDGKKEEVFLRQQALLKRLEIPYETPLFDRNAVLSIMRRDKKAEDGVIRFVLPVDLGKYELREVRDLEKYYR